MPRVDVKKTYKLYIGGDFTMVDGQARTHLAAFSTATGQLTSWAPSADGQVRALVATQGIAGEAGIVVARILDPGEALGERPLGELMAWQPDKGSP